ncbi:hypothetical protein [Dasania marina]|uniref:hypothetical protein n=1 Tax=Dasania marina TaxID=471499 RepID=UPI0012EAC5ED|nr:hypothetical protein [Dasania marina]
MPIATLEYWISKPLWLTLIIALLCSALAQADTDSSIIYEAQHSSSQQLQQRIEKLYPQARVSSQQQQIIVRAPQHQVSEIAELLAIMDKPVQQFVITLSSAPQHGKHKTYSTRSNKLQQRYRLANNETLSLEYARQQQQLLAVRRYYHPLHSDSASMSLQDSDNHSVSLKLQALGPQQVRIDYSLYQLQGDKRSRISNSLVATLGEWVVLEGEPSLAHSTRNTNSLQIRVQQE